VIRARLHPNRLFRILSDTMPAKSKAQQRLMGAALHGADFPKAREVRQSMGSKTLREYASGSMKGKPAHVKAKKR